VALADGTTKPRLKTEPISTDTRYFAFVDISAPL